MLARRMGVGPRAPISRRKRRAEAAFGRKRVVNDPAKLKEEWGCESRRDNPA